MISVARSRHASLEFVLGSAGDLGVPDGDWAGAVAPYSLIHLDAIDRPAAYAELARVIALGGWLLLAFHVSMVGQPVGSTHHLEDWWGHEVDLDIHFLDPSDVRAGLATAGFSVMATTEREPWPGIEAPTRRCSILAHRTGPPMQPA